MVDVIKTNILSIFFFLQSLGVLLCTSNGSDNLEGYLIKYKLIYITIFTLLLDILIYNHRNVTHMVCFLILRFGINNSFINAILNKTVILYLKDKVHYESFILSVKNTKQGEKYIGTISFMSHLILILTEKVSMWNIPTIIQYLSIIPIVLGVIFRSMYMFKRLDTEKFEKLETKYCIFQILNQLCIGCMYRSLERQTQYKPLFNIDDVIEQSNSIDFFISMSFIAITQFIFVRYFNYTNLSLLPAIISIILFSVKLFVENLNNTFFTIFTLLITIIQDPLKNLIYIKKKNQIGLDLISFVLGMAIFNEIRIHVLYENIICIFFSIFWVFNSIQNAKLYKEKKENELCIIEENEVDIININVS